MIYVIAPQFVKPELEDTFLALAQQLMVASRQEPDCVSYELTRRGCDHVLTFVECWKDALGLQRHQKSDAFKNLVPQLHALCSQPGEPMFFETLD